MKKTQKTKKYIAGLLIFAVAVAAYGFLPTTVRAVDSIYEASDTLSDSDVSVEADHTLDFTVGHELNNDDTLEVTFAGDFGVIDANGDITCPADDGLTVSREDSNRTAVCSYSAGLASGTKQIVITDVPNPATVGSYSVEIRHEDVSGNVIERAQVKVAIVDDVIMTARVDATLEFNISGVTSGTDVNSVTCDNDTSATSTDFGTLSPGVPTTVCQQLDVTTNASDGFAVTVEQDQELTSDSGSNINSFNNSPDGTGSTTPNGWASPSGILDVYNTYGHMGITSDDSDLSGNGYTDFSGSAYVGLDGTNQLVVFHHDGPADGSTADKGLANVAYTAEISALQEAGDYENTLTYIATPTY